MAENTSDSPISDIQIGEVTAQWAKSNNLKTNYFKSIDSTNTHAKKSAFEQEELENEVVLYFTEEQTHGRGRFDRTWTNPAKGTGLLSTWSFAVLLPPHPHTTAKVGMALHNALKATWTALPFSLKAPNDLFVGSKKMAGLLIETVSQGAEHRLLIGLGLNVFAFPKDINTATDLISNLPKSTPLLGEDWISFVDRFLYELTLLIPTAHDELSSTQKQNFIELLNLNPLLDKKYQNFKDVVFNI
jgi:BirA family biotin operon repressor/biotin-[acetyl-CoA-carboxylase] ligase